MNAMNEQFEVNFWGSDPNQNNDDCWTGFDFVDKESALRFYNYPWCNENSIRYKNETAFVEITGPDFYAKRTNPEFQPSKQDDDEWNREIAMQAGMMGGIHAYNDSF